MAFLHAIASCHCAAFMAFYYGAVFLRPWPWYAVFPTMTNFWLKREFKDLKDWQITNWYDLRPQKRLIFEELAFWKLYSWQKRFFRKVQFQEKCQFWNWKIRTFMKFSFSNYDNFSNDHLWPNAGKAKMFFRCDKQVKCKKDWLI